jgi:uncharacterized protein YbgA (DUF1722 family)
MFVFEIFFLRRGMNVFREKYIHTQTYIYIYVKKIKIKKSVRAR